MVIRILEVARSTLARRPAILRSRYFHSSTPYLQANAGIVLKIGHDRLFLHSSQGIIHNHPSISI
jgi:hypothetical protein